MRTALVLVSAGVLFGTWAARGAPSPGADGGSTAPRVADPPPPPASNASWDDTARILAGLPVDAGSPLALLQASAAWTRHAQALDAGFTKLKEVRLSKMESWAAEQVHPRIDGGLPLLYLFGGPDALSVDVLYPDAPRYVLAGLELPGTLPPLETLTPKELELALDNLRGTIRTTLSLSYFVTDKVGGDLRKSRLRGVLPVLLLFLARHGDRVLEVEAVMVDASGALVPAPAKPPPSAAPGLRLKFQRGGVGPVRELDYFALDLINDALPAKPGFLPFLERLGPCNSFLKAASFILHDRHFSKVRDLLLRQSASILQDDSGLPFRAFARGKWDLFFFGTYTPNIKVFEDHFQDDLKAAWSKAAVGPLPFATGYPHERGSNLWLAVPRPVAPDAGVPR